MSTSKRANRPARPKRAMAKRNPHAKKLASGRPKRQRRGRGRGNATKFQNRNVHRGVLSFNGKTLDTKHLPQFVEQVGQPLSSQAWALFKSYNVNPGLASVFPVGYSECVNWQKYRFRKLCMVYEPLVNEFNTNNDGAGEVIISFNPDASDSPPGSFTQAINRKPIARGRPCDNIKLEIPPHLLHSLTDAHFLRSAVPPGASDIKTYDIGLVDVSVVGCGTTGTTTLGNLFWMYELDVITQQQALVGAPVNFSVSQYHSTNVGVVTATPTQLLLANVDTNGLGSVNTAGSIVVPPGNYLLDADVTLNCATAITNFNPTFEKNGVGTGPSAIYVAAVAAGTTSMTLSLTQYVTSNGTDTFSVNFPATQTFTGGGGTYSATLRITAI